MFMLNFAIKSMVSLCSMPWHPMKGLLSGVSNLSRNC